MSDPYSGTVEEGGSDPYRAVDSFPTRRTTTEEVSLELEERSVLVVSPGDKEGQNLRLPSGFVRT